MTASQAFHSPMDAADDLILLAPGSTFGNKYAIEERIGIGNIAIVYKCHPIDSPDTSLVLKLLKPSLASDRTSLTRFYKGFLTASQIDHPNVLRVIEYITDGPMVGYTMEFAHNGTLHTMLSRNSEIPIPVAAKVCKDICGGLGAIHAHGAVHRNVGPEQIFFDSENSARLAGFGMVHTETGPKLTKYGNILGSIEYVSPEYIGAGKLDARSDIYALGLVAYRMITGALPFAGCSPVDALSKRISSDPAPAMESRPDCPEELNRIVMKALSREPDDRYPQASEMLSDLKALLGESSESPQSEQVAPEAPFTAPLESTIQATIEVTSKINDNVDSSSTLLDKEMEACLAEAQSAIIEERSKTRSALKIWLLRLVSIVVIFWSSYIFFYDLYFPKAAPRRKATVAKTVRKLPPAKISVKMKENASVPVKAIPKKAKLAPKPATKPVKAVQKPAPQAPQKQKSVATTEAKTKPLPTEEKPAIQKPEPAAPPAVEKTVPQEEKITVAKEISPPAPAPAPKQVSSKVATPAADTFYATYTVVPGDTISQISRKYLVTPKALMKLNHISDPRQLPVGTVLKIPY